MRPAFEIAEEFMPCLCSEVYLSREMSSPDCPLHSFRIEDAINAARKEAIEECIKKAKKFEESYVYMPDLETSYRQIINKLMGKIELTVEKSQDHFWGFVEGMGYAPNGQGETIEDLIANVKDCIEDYVEHEGKNDDVWNKINLTDLVFDIKYI